MTRRAGVWLWRWRRNPLRRRCDLVEAWVLLAAWIIALAGGLLAGLLTAGSMQESSDLARAEGRQVTAVLIRDPEHRATVHLEDGTLTWGTVRWTAADGSTHTGRTRVSATAHAGSRMTVWTDRHGALTPRPPSRTDAALQSALGGFWAGAATAGVVMGGAWLVRARLDHRRMDQWAEEWAQAATRWGRKTG